MRFVAIDVEYMKLYAPFICSVEAGQGLSVISHLTFAGCEAHMLRWLANTYATLYIQITTCYSTLLSFIRVLRFIRNCVVLIIVVVCFNNPCVFI